MKHFVDATFPSNYSGFQKELLSRIFVPVDIRVTPEIYRSEREGKNLFRVKYTNGGTPQGSFFLETHINTSRTAGTRQSIEGTMKSSSLAEMTRDIVAAKNDVAGSLSRAAAALRSIAAVQVRRPPGSDKAAR